MQHPERIRSDHPAPIRGEVVEAPRARRVRRDPEPVVYVRRPVHMEGWPMARNRRIAGLVGFPGFIVGSGILFGVPLGITLVFAVVAAFLWVVVSG